ncbi:DUF202 domain-containing protein [Variovorax sp. J31P179]|uniref:YidH family protein n=1 Tax=Variovorax sp. J31P179 TaxID=3053508 RepID=UPI002574C3D6|nr:DUF202 domain-containing protein [Variovorax sp. J31P179]MDM0084706.1 DUF202 domain-containing protein [Variovorax sp. J31P179]
MKIKLLDRPAWQREGVEPDYRFSLANERTFLAWIRTALAILAGGILLDQFSTKLQPHLAVEALAISLCMLATLLCIFAYRRWAANEVAMRHSAPLPHARPVGLLGVWALAVAAIVTVLLVLR